MHEIFEQLLKEKNISRYRVSKDTGISQSMLADWVNGRSNLGSENLAKIADYFDVSVDYLMGREKKSPSPVRGAGEIDPIYLSLAKDMQTSGIHPDDVRDIVELLKRRRND